MIFSFVTSRNLAANAANIPSVLSMDKVMQTSYTPAYEPF